jgi:cellulase/cellobiase CelA1
LSSKPRNGSTTKASPYIGARYEISKNAAIETRVITNTDQKTIISNRVTVSEKIGNNVAVTATIGFDKGINTKYNNTYGLVGLKWVF